jgi:hypothetical protein
MSAIDAILGKSAAPTAGDDQSAAEELRREAAEPDTYRACVIRSRPQMGFALAESDGTLHGFMYHTLRHPKHQVRNGEEFLSFTADGMAVVMQGTGLRTVFLALLRHTLAEAREYDGSKPIEDGSIKVERLEVRDTRAEEQRPPSQPRLVK